MSHENLISGTKNSEDASVFKLDDDTALVQTLDFITPVVDDPYIYGQIAAANALSDCFAMGANAINALNILGFDSCHFDQEVASLIMAGGANKAKECGAAIIGGHSINSAELFYGLSVTGIAKNGVFWANNTAKVGDVLILTKPLGFGVMTTAIKANMASKEQMSEVIKLMSQLNFYALQALSGIRVNAATDITGFGLIGHLSEMAREDIKFVLDAQSIPILQSSKQFASMGLIPEGSYKNQDYSSKFVDKEADILLYDPQTSGGLVLSIPQEQANQALSRLKDAGYIHSCIIANVKAKDPKQKSIELV